MKDLLSKERYCYKIPTSLTKSSAYPILQTTILFLQENFDSPPPMISQKSQMLSKIPNKRGNFYEYSGSLDWETTTFGASKHVAYFVHFEYVEVILDFSIEV